MNQITPMGMRPKFYVILGQAIEEGVIRGYRKSFKYEEHPSEQVIIDTIEESVLSSIHEYFTFEKEDL